MFDFSELGHDIFEIILTSAQSSRYKTRVGIISLSSIVNSLVSRLMFIGILPTLNGTINDYTPQEIFEGVIQAIAEGEYAVNRRIDTDMTGYLAICRKLAEMLLDIRAKTSSSAEKLHQAA